MAKKMIDFYHLYGAIKEPVRTIVSFSQGGINIGDDFFIRQTNYSRLTKSSFFYPSDRNPDSYRESDGTTNIIHHQWGLPSAWCQDTTPPKVPYECLRQILMGLSKEEKF